MAHQLRAQSIIGFAPLVAELGGDAQQLLRSAGLDPAELEQPDIYISHRAFIQLLEDAASKLRCPDFGLRLLDRQDLSVLGPIALAAQHAADLLEALDCFARYIHVQGSALRLYLLPQADPGQVMIAVDLRLRRQIARRQQVELAVGLAHKAIDLLTGGRCKPLAICLPHSRIAPLRRRARVLGVSRAISSACTPFASRRASTSVTLISGWKVRSRSSSTSRANSARIRYFRQAATHIRARASVIPASAK